MAPVGSGPAAQVGPRRRFGRRDRLRASRDFQRVSRRGRRASSGSFVVLAAPREPAAGAAGPGETQFVQFARLGVTVSRRVGGAVVRNRVKRRLREWFRTSPVRAAGPLDLVVIARPPAATLAGEALRRELDGLCGRLVGGCEA